MLEKQRRIEKTPRFISEHINRNFPDLSSLEKEKILDAIWSATGFISEHINCLPGYLPSLEKEEILNEIWSAPGFISEHINCINPDLIWSPPGFIVEHINRFPPDLSSHRILFHDANSSNWCKEPPSPFRSVVRCMSNSMIIVGSINSLICTEGSDEVRYDDDEGSVGSMMMILNPVTRHLIKLPPPSTPLSERYEDRVTYAFWWDSVDYKVVRIFSRMGIWSCASEEWTGNPFHSNPPISAEFWVSSSPDKWTDIPIDFDHPFYHSFYVLSTACDIIVEGVAYWIVIEKHNKGKFVLSLDMATLVWNPISLPEQSTKPSFFITKDYEASNNVSFFAANWKGVFALVERNEADHLHTVWTISRGGEWRTCTSFCLDYQYLWFLNLFNGKIALLTKNKQITLLDIETQAFEDLEDVGYNSFIISVHDFVGSSVSIKEFEPLSKSNIGPLLTFIWPDPGKNTKEGSRTCGQV